jgi:hypothetical protein
MKSRTMGCAGNVGCVGRREMDTGFWWENHRERDNLEDTVVVGRIILKYFKNGNGGGGVD